MIAFAKIVESGSISAAAVQMGFDKAAVSRQLRDLENQLGVKLLHRTTRHQVLTDAGVVVFERAQRVVYEVEHARTEAESFHQSPSGVLTVSASVAFGKLHLVPLLGTFLAQYPDLELQLCLLDRQVDLVDEGVDVLLRLCNEPPQNFAAYHLSQIKYAIVASPELAKKFPAKKPADLNLKNCLFYGFKTRNSTWRFSKAGQEELIQVSTRISVNSSEAVRELAISGLGMALLPEFAIADDLNSGKLVRLLEDFEVQGNLGSSLYAIYLAGRFSTPKVRAFVDFLREQWSGAGRPSWTSN
jgi:DNA-binding transcriptional LysR family regulator